MFAQLVPQSSTLLVLKNDEDREADNISRRKAEIGMEAEH